MTYDTEDPKLQAIMVDLVDEYTSIIARGESTDIDAMADRHPEYADEIRDILATLRSLLDFEMPLLAEQELQDGVRMRQLGDYQLVREVGRGGMGVIYEATQISMNRRVALKVLPFAGLADPSRLNRFRNEVRAAGTLNHPHIVPVYAVGSDRGLNYFAMQFIDGPSADVLTNTLRANEPQTSKRSEPNLHPLPAAETNVDIQAFISTQREESPHTYHRTVARWGADAAEALAHAHENGVLHRDIKPGNLLIDGQGKVWVADFGLARIESDVSMTVTGDRVGTLRYMAPEQALTKRVLIDHRADIYALGATLYEMLSLHPVWNGKTREELLHQISVGTPTPLGQLIPTIERDLETILHKAIEKDPGDRYHSAQDFADDLQRYLDGRSIQARPLSVAMKCARWVGKHPGKSAALAASLLAVTMFTSWVMNYRRNARSAIESRLAMANAYFESSQFESAQKELAVARTTLESPLAASSFFSARIAESEKKVGSRQQAYTTHAEFHALYDEITTNLHFATSGEMDDLFQKCQQALSNYRSADDFDLARHIDFQTLNPQEQLKTKERYLELLFVTAVAGIGSSHGVPQERERSYRQAIELLSSISELSHPSAGTEYWSAYAYRGLQRIDEARTKEKAAADLASQSYLDWLMLGEYQYAQLQMNDAARSFEMALQAEPQGYLALMSLANTLELLNDLDDGRAQNFRLEGVCTGAIALNPNSPHPYLLRAQARSGIDGMHDLADADLAKAVRIAPHDHRVIEWQATFEGRHGNRSKCLALFEQAAQVAPTVLPGRAYWHANWLLVAYDPNDSKTEEKRQAIEILTVMLNTLPAEIEPGLGTFFNAAGHNNPWQLRVSALIRRALAHRVLGAAETARRDLEAAIEFPVKSENQRFLRGLAFLLLDRHDDFVKVFANVNFAEVSQTNVSEELLCLANLMGRNVETFLERIVAEFPSHWRDPHTAKVCDAVGICYYDLASLYYRDGKHDEAIPLYTKAVEFAPDKATPHFSLGKCFFVAGDYPNAVRSLTRAIELDPEHAVAYAQRAFSHAALGELEAAVSDFDRLLGGRASTVWEVRAVYQLKLGRLDDYRASIVSSGPEASSSQLARGWPQPSDDVPTWWFTLAPIDWDGMNEVVDVARERARESEAKHGPLSPETLVLRKELGTALYRLGKSEEAVEELTAALTLANEPDAMKTEDRILAASFLSLAESKRGNRAAAEQWLDQANQWMAPWNGKGWRRIRVELAISEAAATLTAD